MAKIITIINQKGGVGKTTTAQTVGAWIQIYQNKKVLFLDLDQQGNLTYSIDGCNSDFNALEVLVSGKIDHKKIQTTQTGYQLIPSTPMLASVDMALNDPGKEYRLKEALSTLKDYDFVIIDTPPSLNILTINALTASDFALIPAQADIFSLQGITQLKSTLEAVKKYTNPHLNVLGIILIKHNERTVLNRDLQQVLIDTSKHIHTKVYSQYIRESVVVKEAQATKKDIFSYNSDNNVAKDYNNLMLSIWKEINV